MGFQPENDPVEAIGRRYRLNGSDPLIVPYGNITTFSSPGCDARFADATDSHAAARQAG
jgi:hypothetical protein